MNAKLIVLVGLFGLLLVACGGADQQQLFEARFEPDSDSGVAEVADEPTVEPDVNSVDGGSTTDSQPEGDTGIQPPDSGACTVPLCAAANVRHCQGTVTNECGSVVCDGTKCERGGCTFPTATGLDCSCVRDTDDQSSEFLCGGVGRLWRQPTVLTNWEGCGSTCTQTDVERDGYRLVCCE